KVRVLFDQLAFRTLMPRLLDAVGEVAAVAVADTFDVDVRVLRDARAAVQYLEAITAAGEPYALEPRWEGVPVTSSLRALGIARGDGAAYLDADLLRDSAVHDAIE